MESFNGHKILFYLVMKADSIVYHRKRNNEAYHKSHMCLLVIDRFDNGLYVRQECTFVLIIENLICLN